MYGNSPQRAAETYLDYISTRDAHSFDDARSQLVLAGQQAVAPLIDALIAKIRELGSSAVWGKAETDELLSQIERRDILGEEYLEKLREKFSDMPDDGGPRLSIASARFSREARDLVWQLISQIGWSAEYALFQLVNGRDLRKRLAALLVLAAEGNHTRFGDRLEASAPLHEAPATTDQMENCAQLLVISMLASGGNSWASQILDQYCSESGIGRPDFPERILDQCISLLAT